MGKYSAYFLKKNKQVIEQYFEGKDVADAVAQAKDYAKDTKQVFSSLWQLQRLSSAGRPIVNKEAKGRLDQRSGSKSAYKSKGGYAK